MIILGIETSCDETAISVVENGSNLLSNVIRSQVEIHAQHGGIVPEIASRAHVAAIIPALQQSLNNANVKIEEVDKIGVTFGPGLAGSLLVGVNLAKTLAYIYKKPLLGINHIEAHIYSSWLEKDNFSPKFPLICMVASGGHTELILMKNHGDYQILGQTKDDAAGEAFDKAARVLGLSYPGGPEIQKHASDELDVSDLGMPRPLLREGLDFSFSGLKTAFLNKARSKSTEIGFDLTQDPQLVSRMAWEFQEAITEVLATKIERAVNLSGAKMAIVGGGVAANARLRQRIEDQIKQVPVVIPRPGLCIDNGAMIAACAYFKGYEHNIELDVNPGLSIEDNPISNYL
tara:strand:+ start:212 stop:1249 length:1038 start_codon:yes stop_codon:yes gene_type:complete